MVGSSFRAPTCGGGASASKIFGSPTPSPKEMTLLPLEAAGGPNFPVSRARRSRMALDWAGDAVRDPDRHLAELARPPELLGPGETGYVEVDPGVPARDAGEGQESRTLDECPDSWVP